MLRKWIDTWIGLRWPLLAIGVIAGVAALWGGQQLEFDRSIENMFSPGDPLIPPYRKFNATFGGNEIIMGVYREPDLYAADGEAMARLTEFRLRLEALEGVCEVLALDRPPIDKFVLDPNSNTGHEVLKLFAGFTHDADLDIAALPIQLEPGLDNREELVETIRQMFAEMPGGMITGEPVMVVDGFDYVEQDGARLGWATTLLLGLVILLAFRSLRWVVIALLVVQLTLWSTQSLLAAIGMQLSMVSSMLTAIVTVIGVATVIHLITRFRQYRGEGDEPREALARSVHWLAAPVFWACVTDAVGFCSLLITKVGPVHDFGIMMSVGALLVPIAAFLLLPGMILSGRWGVDPAQVWGEGFLEHRLRWTIDRVERHPTIISLVAILLLGVSLYGATRLEVESDFTKNFREGTPIVQAYNFVEDELGGAGIWDIALPAPEKLTRAYLRQVRDFERELRTEAPELSKVLSLADVLYATTPIDPHGPGLAFVFRTALNRAVGMLDQEMPRTLASLHGQDPDNPDRYWFRVMLLSPERQDAEAKKALIAKVEAHAATFEWDGADSTDEPYVTGFYILLTNLIDSLIADQWKSFLLATAGIGVTMSIAFRSVRYGLIALVPNILPVLLVTGLIGLSGYRINMGAAMIAAVSMGLSVDSSIHYIMSFQRCLRDGQNAREALQLVQHGVGRAVVFSTLALIVGFSVLCFSDFIPTIYFGVLVSLTMLGGLIGNLIVLPLLLQLVTPAVNRSP